jgi:hypothetical protein
MPDNPVAKQIIACCAQAFPANNGDCVKFLNAALSAFMPPGYLNGLDADAVVGKLQSPTAGWTRSRAIGEAIAQAKSGNLVIAGMTSAALGQGHGHVAVTVGLDGQQSGGTIVPLGYAGSLGNASARIAGARLSGTFPAALVRGQGLDYYFKPPDRIPA